jgi:hypothetical protein
MYVRAYVFAYMLPLRKTCTYMWLLHTDSSPCIHAHLHTYIHTYIHTHIHTYIQIVSSATGTSNQAEIHTYRRTYIHTYRCQVLLGQVSWQRIHTYRRTYIYTYIQVSSATGTSNQAESKSPKPLQFSGKQKVSYLPVVSSNGNIYGMERNMSNTYAHIWSFRGSVYTSLSCSRECVDLFAGVYGSFRGSVYIYCVFFAGVCGFQPVFERGLFISIE